jgi:hypothetical protein
VSAYVAERGSRPSRRVSRPEDGPLYRPGEALRGVLAAPDGEPAPHRGRSCSAGRPGRRRLHAEEEQSYHANGGRLAVRTTAVLSMAAVNEGRVKDALMGHTDLLGECPHCRGQGMPVILFRCVTTDELTASRTASFRCDGGQGIASSHSWAMAQRGVRARDDHPDHDAAVFVMLRGQAVVVESMVPWTG